MAVDETTGTSSTGRLTEAQKRRLRESARRREAERRREATRARDEQRRAEAREKSVAPTRARPPVMGESARDKVPAADPATDRLRPVQAERNRKVAARDRFAASLAAPQDFSAGRTVRRLGTQLKEIPAELGPALVTVGKAVGKDSYDYLTNPLGPEGGSFKRTREDVLKPLARDLKYLASPGPVIVRRDEQGRTVYRTPAGGETLEKKQAARGYFEKFEERPLDYLLIGRGSALGAGNVAARAGQTGRLGERAKQLGTPGQRSLEARTGGRFSTPTSANPVRRQEQELMRKLTTGATRKVEETIGRELPVVGEHARAVRLGKKQQTRAQQADVSRAVRPFQRAFHGIKPSGRIAIVLRAQGVSPSQMRAFVEQELADARTQYELSVDVPEKARALKGEIRDHERMLRVLSKTSDDVYSKVDTDPKLIAAFEAARTLSGKTGDLLEALNKLDPVARELRPYLTARVVGGARFVEQKAQKGRAAQTRLYPGRSRTVERPRSVEEAEQRVRELETFLEPRIQTVYRYLRDVNPTRASQGDKRPRRVQSDADKFKTQAIGQGDFVDKDFRPIRERTGAQARDRDWQRAEEIIYKRAQGSQHPVMRKIAAAMDELDALKAGVLREREGDALGDEITLYHRTTPAAAAEIRRTGKLTSRENTGEVFASTHRQGQARGYGEAVVPIRVPRDRARLDDEFPDGEQHFAVPADAVRIADQPFGTVREVIPGKPRKVQLREIEARRRGGDFQGGPDVEQLKQDLADLFQFPHTGPKLRTTPPQKQAGRVPPKAPGITKRNKAIRLLASRWLPAPEAWSDAYVKAVGYAHALDRGELAMRVAKPLNEAGETDKGWYYVNLDQVTTPRGKPQTRKIPRAERERADLIDQLDELLEAGDGDLEGFVRERVASRDLADVRGWIERETQRTGKPPRIGQISPEDYRNLFGEFAPATALTRILLERPTNFWRTLTLTYRPAWVVNNFLGQNLLYAINNATPGGVKAYAQAALDEARGNDDRYFPEDLRFGLFQAEAAPGQLAGTGRFTGATNSAIRVAAVSERKMRDAIQRFNAGVTDNTPRRAAFYRLAAKETAFLNRLEGTNRSFDEFLTELRRAAEDPVRGDKKLRETHDRLVQETLDQLIDFNDLSTFERRVIRRAVPFYSWIKGITKATVKLGLDSPLRVAFLSIVAQTIGDEELERLVGRGSDVLNSFAPLGKARQTERGREQTGLATGGLNPFQTVSDVVGYAGDAFGGSGADPRANPALAANPVIRGLIETASRRDLFTGKELAGPRATILPKQFVRSFPIVSTIERSVRDEDPLTKSGKPKLTVPNQSTRFGPVDVPNEALNYLGYPVRVKNLDTAEAIAEKELREDLSPEAREFRKVFADRRRFYEAARASMPQALENGRLPKKLRDAFNIEAERQAMYARASKGKRAGTVEYQRARYEADLRLLVKHGLVTRERADAVLTQARAADFAAIKDARREISERYYQAEGGQLFYISHARRALIDAGATLND